MGFLVWDGILFVMFGLCRASGWGGKMRNAQGRSLRKDVEAMERWVMWAEDVAMEGQRGLAMVRFKGDRQMWEYRGEARMMMRGRDGQQRKKRGQG